jgi:hypothetical protein
MPVGQHVLDVAPLRDAVISAGRTPGAWQRWPGNVVAETAASWEVYALTWPPLAVGPLTLPESIWDFTKTTDEEVRDHLRAAPGSRIAAASAPGPTEVAVIRAEAIPVEDGVPADQVLFNLVGDANLVLIGEASHGSTSSTPPARA